MGGVLRCWLVRHAKVDAGDKLYGASDWPCLPIADRDVQFLRTNLPPKASYLTSGLQRTHQTLEKIAPHKMRTRLQDIRLNEQSLGVLEGKPFAELDENEEWQKLLRDFATYCPQGGESFADVVCRVGSKIDELSSDFAHGRCSTAEHKMGDDEENYIMVVHAGVIRAAIVHTLGLEVHKAMQCAISHLSLTVLEYREHWQFEGWGWRLLTMNQSGDLHFD